MDSVHIRGGNSLMGEVTVQGSKNGALPLLTATVLIEGKTTLHNCPQITDITAMLDLLQGIGCNVKSSGRTVTVDATHIKTTQCPPEQVRAMRSSIMLLGPMLGRCGHVQMYRPGGCVIGKRPVDIHEMALSRMNVRFSSKEDEIIASVGQLTAADIQLPFPSVGATENVIMAAVLAEGTTVLRGAAMEPEIMQLCRFLNMAGAKIRLLHAGTLEIIGVKELHEVSATVAADRIVAGTYLLAAAATRGQIIVHDAPTRQLTSLLSVLRQMGAQLFLDDDIICIDAQDASLPIPHIKTEVYPGFPTDLQSMLTAVLASAGGNSEIEETIFEDRFKVAAQLNRMGASIQIIDKRIQIEGNRRLYGCRVQAFELRGGAALILAGLSAEGETTVEGCEYIRRGYEDICRDLRLLSANIYEQGK